MSAIPRPKKHDTAPAAAPAPALTSPASSIDDGRYRPRIMAAPDDGRGVALWVTRADSFQSPYSRTAPAPINAAVKPSPALTALAPKPTPAPRPRNARARVGHRPIPAAAIQGHPRAMVRRANTPTTKKRMSLLVASNIPVGVTDSTADKFRAAVVNAVYTLESKGFAVELWAVSASMIFEPHKKHKIEELSRGLINHADHYRPRFFCLVKAHAAPLDLPLVSTVFHPEHYQRPLVIRPIFDHQNGSRCGDFMTTPDYAAMTPAHLAPLIGCAPAAARVLAAPSSNDNKLTAEQWAERIAAAIND